MKNWFVIHLIIFLIPFLGVSQNEVVYLEPNFKEKKIENQASIWRDDELNSNIEKVLKLKGFDFKKVTNFNIMTGLVKHRGWIKFEVISEVNQEVLLEVLNPNLDNLKIYQTDGNQILSRIENLSKTEAIEHRNLRSRTFIEKIKLNANQKNTIYLSHDVRYSITNIPIKIWQENTFLEHQESQKQFQFIFYGILIIIMTACLLGGLLLRIKLFTIFGFNILALILHFLYISGTLTQTIPQLVASKFHDLHLLIVFSPFLIHILFVHGLTRLDEHKFKIIRKLYQVIVWFSAIYFAFTVFLPIWVPIFSHTILNSIYIIAVLVFPTSLIYFFFAIYSSLERTIFVKFYLVASVIGLTITLIAFLNTGFISIHSSFNYDHIQIGILMVLFILFIGLLFQIREYFSINQESTYIPDTQVQVLRNSEKLSVKEEVAIPNVQVLTKREIEILKAFTNGFTHQEIAEAMFISPHTAKTHLKTIYRKLNINSKVEAVKWVIENEI